MATPHSEVRGKEEGGRKEKTSSVLVGRRNRRRGESVEGFGLGLSAQLTVVLWPWPWVMGLMERSAAEDCLL